MTRGILRAFLAVVLAGGFLAPWQLGLGDDGFPSTNEKNRDQGWGHVNAVAAGEDAVRLEFVSSRRLYSCFEYRADGDETAIIEDNEGRHYNQKVEDGLYPYFCQYNSERTETIPAEEYVEVRLVFGDDPQERFGWTRFEVGPAAEE